MNWFDLRKGLLYVPYKSHSMQKMKVYRNMTRKRQEKNSYAQV